MPALLILDTSALGLTVLISFTLAFTVGAAGFRRRLNHDFSLFAFFAVAQSACSLLMRLSLFYRIGDSLLLFQLAATCFFAMCPFLLMFVAHYLGFSGAWPDLAGAAVMACIAALAPFLYTGRFVSGLRMDSMGATYSELTLAGSLIQLLPVLIFLSCLLLLLLRRTRVKEPFFGISVIVLLTGYCFAAVSPLKAPALSVTTCASVSILGWGIMRKQLFNPLRDLAANLQERSHRQALIASIGQKTTALIGLDELLTQAVALIGDSFAYSSVVILLIEGEHLVLRASSLALFQSYARKYRLKVGEEGICGWVAATGRAMCVPDVDREPRYASLTAAMHTRSELAVPIRRGTEVIGVLDIQSPLPDAFDNADIAAQQTIADQLSSSIANARLYEQLMHELATRKRTERFLHSLNNAALAMEHARAPAEIFRIAMSELSDLGLACAALLSDHAGGKLVLAGRSTADGQVEILPSARTDAEADAQSCPSVTMDQVPAIADALRRQATVSLEPDDAMLSVFPALSPLATDSAQGPGQTVFAPLAAVGEQIGLLAARGEGLAPENIELFSAFAHLTAAAWRRARLMEDLEGSLAQLQRMQEQLLHAQKMEAVGRLAGGIAHDFNNLLTVISGYASLLAECVEGNAPALTNLSEIKSTIKRASGLTSRLLAFSRKQVVQPAVIELNRIVAGSEDLLRPLIGAQVELVVKLTPLPVPVHADPYQLEQVIINLAVNARDAMPEGGRLLLETSNIDLTASCLSTGCPAAPADLQPGPYAVLCVQDWGTGMSAETREHLFEPFYTTKEWGKGTGLGLSIVYGIITQTGGRVRVDSAPGVGSTFMIWIPRVPATDTESEPRAGNAVEPK